VPVAKQLAAVPDLDKRLADLEKALNSVPDQKSTTATTARYILEAIKEARQDPGAFDPRTAPPNATPSERDANASKRGPGAAPRRAVEPHTPPKISDYVATIGGLTMDFDAALTRATRLAAEIKAGRDPLKGATGDLHLAYRSDLDGMLLPYRIYIPTTYKRSQKYPLIMFLHGAGCDENTFMNSGVLQRAAERHGYIVASVNGRGPLSGYCKENGAEKDVFDVMGLMQKYYSVDAESIFLTGHSMGGVGTWRIGLDYRDRFAALAPMAGTRLSVDLDAKLPSGRRIPILRACQKINRTS
jgi:acetyl esterase/lipase